MSTFFKKTALIAFLTMGVLLMYVCIMHVKYHYFLKERYGIDTTFCFPMSFRGSYLYANKVNLEVFDSQSLENIFFHNGLKRSVFLETQATKNHDREKPHKSTHDTHKVFIQRLEIDIPLWPLNAVDFNGYKLKTFFHNGSLTYPNFPIELGLKRLAFRIEHNGDKETLIKAIALRDISLKSASNKHKWFIPIIDGGVRCIQGKKNTQYTFTFNGRKINRCGKTRDTFALSCTGTALFENDTPLIRMKSMSYIDAHDLYQKNDIIFYMDIKNKCIKGDNTIVRFNAFFDDVNNLLFEKESLSKKKF